jgi:2'-5' RNA ligase
MRLFVALPLSPAVCDEIAHVSERFISADDGFRWTEPVAWHITLQFLGNSHSDRLADLVENLGKVNSPALPIQLGAIGFFDRSRVVYLEVRLSPELIAFQQKIVQATGHCGFLSEERPYHPHITLARAKNKLRKEQQRALDAKMRHQVRFSKLVVNEFLLYESYLGSEGSRYEVRARFPLPPLEG